MPLYYIDTSALVKRYHVEQGSEQVERLFSDQTAVLVTSNLTITELTSALDRKVQERRISEEGLARVLAVAARDLLKEFWLIELDRNHIKHSQQLILQHHLRSLDALHLATFLSIKDLAPTLVSADQRLLGAALRESMQIFNPEIPSQ